MQPSELEVVDPGGSRSAYALPREGETVAGKYRIVRRIGEGGMGVIFEGLHLLLNKRVALKFLAPQAMECRELTARFEREARAAGQLTGPHAVQILDVARMDSGLPFIVMELLVGRDLDREMRVRCGERFAVEQAVDLILETCDAMAEAHALGIVHRDLKPANLFLASQEDGQRIVKVLDFGISKILRDSQADVTETCTAIGTPLYMAPEQVRSARDVDARADIWSLGIILYELLTGDPPFMGSGTSVLAAVVADPTPGVREKRKDVPAGLEAVIQRALKKAPEERFPDVHYFAAALSPYASNEVRKRRRVGRLDRVSCTAFLTTPRAKRWTRAAAFAALIVPLLMATAFGARRSADVRVGVIQRTHPAMAEPQPLVVDDVPAAVPAKLEKPSVMPASTTARRAPPAAPQRTAPARSRTALEQNPLYL